MVVDSTPDKAASGCLNNVDSYNSIRNPTISFRLSIHPYTTYGTSSPLVKRCNLDLYVKNQEGHH